MIRAGSARMYKEHHCQQALIALGQYLMWGRRGL